MIQRLRSAAARVLGTLGCLLVVIVSMSAMLASPAAVAQTFTCTADNTITARVVALDQAWVWNRYGAIQPHGMMFALERDVRALDPAKPLSPGNVVLRNDKRPRPIALRVNKGSCLKIIFTNLLDRNRRNEFVQPLPPHHRCARRPDDEPDCGDQPADRMAGFHVTGLAPEDRIESLAQDVGGNRNSSAVPSPLAAPGETRVYTLRAEQEGTFFAYSPAATSGADGNGGSIHAGLFGAVTVEPKGSRWFRSQVSEAEMRAAMNGSSDPSRLSAAAYERFAILAGNEIIHSDLNAIIDMRGATVAAEMLCLDENGRPYPVCGDRKKSFREFTVIFHDESGAVQAFPEFDAVETDSDDKKALAKTLHGVRDGFAINYGTAGAGAEVLATRKRVGPTRNCIECQMEEFFLSSWVVGDPSMIVDRPANMQVPGMPYAGMPSQKAFYPDDPSNVFHSYLNDRVVIRNIHAGPKEHHVFHLHAHQWLQVTGKPESAYLDSQTIGPGGAYSYEIAYGGSGNRNRTPGDSIFHCHFYPHFAQGMWALWRVHDVFEAGSKLDTDGRVAEGARAMPDGEIARGTPIPGVVPLPDTALPPVPGPVRIVNGQIDPGSMDDPTVPATYRYPGYPFYIPATAGRRPPAPPEDVDHDGGLERHVVTGGNVIDRRFPPSLVRDYDSLSVKVLPEAGTAHEQRAFDYHARASHPSRMPFGGGAAAFATNGRPPQHGAPFADPCDDGSPVRTFEAGVFQYDMIFTRKGWHTPQARIIALREDIKPTLSGDRLPQPFFIRARSGDCVNFKHSNLVPREYRLDAFQLNVPTDIIAQHIHLVKFDVQASDGGANGFNYEDGTPSPDEVVERIMAIRQGLGCDPDLAATRPDPATNPAAYGTWHSAALRRAKGLDGHQDTRADCHKAKRHPWDPANEAWIGGQITVQRWFADPQRAPDWRGASGSAITKRQVTRSLDKTLDTVFTHDHFGASTHQQAGLYAGLIVEPAGSRWFDTDSSNSLVELGVGRADGGPTSWKAMVVGTATGDLFREYALNYQDFHIAFERDSATRGVNPPWQVAADTNLFATPPRKQLVKHQCPPNSSGICWPETVSADDIGVMSINYRAEPIPPRIWDPATSAQAAGEVGSLAHMFRSIRRADPDLNRNQSEHPLVGGVSRPSWPVPTPGMRPSDPFTPLIETYEQEKFRIRLLAGAHEHEHSFTINGLAWQPNKTDPDSGYRSFQGTALSEHFEMDGILDIPSALSSSATFGRERYFKQLDHLYKIGASIEDVWYGNWGLIRTYNSDNNRPHLPPLNDVAERVAGSSLGMLTGQRALRDRALGEVRERLGSGYRSLTADDLRELIRIASEIEESLRQEAAAANIAVGTSAAVAWKGQVGNLAVASPDRADRVATRNALREALLARRSASMELAAQEAAGVMPASKQVVKASIDDEEAAAAIIRVEYEDMIETLQGLRMDAAMYLAAERQDAAALQERWEAFISGVRDIAQPPPTQITPANLDARFAKLRVTLPILVDGRDPQAIPVCDPKAPLRYFWVVAADAKSLLRESTLVYHRFPLGTQVRTGGANVETWRRAHDPNALLYVRGSDISTADGKLRADRKVEPLILHARAGECVRTLLSNEISTVVDRPGYSTMPNIAEKLNYNELATPSEVGLHAQTVRHHVGFQSGMNVGTNAPQTVRPGETTRYTWYAGVLKLDRGTVEFQPTEFGALNLMPAEPVRQGGKGLFGALVIEPKGSVWGHDLVQPEPFSGSNTMLRTRASSTVFTAGGDGSWPSFKDFVLVGQNDANLNLSGSRGSFLFARRPFDEPVRRVAMCADGGSPCPIKAEEVDAVDMGHKAFNYRSEAGWMRRLHPAAMSRDQVVLQQQHDQLSDLFKGRNAPNQTPRFCARPGDDVRVRLLFPNGHGRNHVMEIAGHTYDDQPFVNRSTELGTDELSHFRGTKDVFGTGSATNALLADGAGGSGKVSGDYAIRDLYSWGFDGGMWAVLRVNERCW